MTETYSEVTYAGVSAAAGHIPHPESRTDRTARAAAQAAPVAPAANQDEPEPSYVVATRQDMPEECIPRTQVLSATNPFLLLLPRDMRRRRVVVLAVSNDILLCETKELAQLVAASVVAGSPQYLGAYLPKGIAISLESRDQVFAVASTTASVSPVTVITERYADPGA